MPFPRFRRVTFLAFLSALLLLTSCGTLPIEGEQTPADGSDIQSNGTPTEVEADREVAASPPEREDVEGAASSTALFGFDMFAGLSALSPDENVITSPYSAAVLLTMLMNGADGETREAIGEVLNLEDPFDDTINAQYQALSEYLMAADPDVELAIANSLWAAEDRPFEDDYMISMRNDFNAEVQSIDLGSPEAVAAIDEWVSEQTRDRIEEIAEDLELPDPNVILVLLHAVYFLGDWTQPFDEEETQNGPFTVSDGSEVEVPLMNQTEMFDFIETPDFQALRLPYGESERFAMDVFLPDEDLGIEGLRETLDVDEWNTAVDELRETRLAITLPTFELEYDTGNQLNNVLKNLGMGIAFDAGADFSLMSPANPWLDDVIQKTYIQVYEQGTEAAAVTGADMPVSEPPQFKVDRPFLFTLSDAETGTILFLGQVTDPSE